MPLDNIAINITANASQAVNAIQRTQREGRRLQNTFQNVQQEARRMAGGLASVGGALSLGVTAPIAFAGTQALQTAAEFEKGFNQIQAVTGATNQALEGLREKAIEVSGSTQFGVGQVTAAIDELARTGAELGAIQQSIGKFSDFAAANNRDLGQATVELTDIASQFGIELENIAKLTNNFTATANSAATDTQQLAEAYKQVGPIANAAGMGIQQTSAALAVLANAGLKAEKGGTNLRGVIASLQAPSNAAKKQLKSLGVETTNAAGEFRGILPIFQELKEANLSSAQATEIFGREASAGALTLTKNIDKLKQYQDQLAQVSGTTKEAAEQQRQGLAFAFESVKSSLDALFIRLASTGALDIVTSAFQGLSSALQTLGKIIKSTPLVGRLITGLAATAAVAGPLIATVGGLAFAFSIVSGPVLALSAAIAGFVALSGALLANWEPVSDFLENILGSTLRNLQSQWEVFRNTFQAEFDLEPFQELWETLQGIGETITNTLTKAFDSLFGTETFQQFETASGLGEDFADSLEYIADTADDSIKAVRNFFDEMDVGNRIVRAAEDIRNFFSGFVDTIDLSPIVDSFQSWGKAINSVWGAIQSLVIATAKLFGGFEDVSEEQESATKSGERFAKALNAISSVLGKVSEAAAKVTEWLGKIVDYEPVSFTIVGIAGTTVAIQSLNAAFVTLKAVSLASVATVQKAAAAIRIMGTVSAAAATKIGLTTAAAKIFNFVLIGLTATLRGLKWALKTAWLAATGPIGLVIAAVGAVTVAVIELERRFGIFSKMWDATWGAIKETAAQFKRDWQVMQTQMGADWKEFTNQVEQVWNRITKRLSQAFDTVRQGIIDTITKAWQWLKDQVSVASDIGGKIANAFSEAFKGPIKALQDWWQGLPLPWRDNGATQQASEQGKDSGKETANRARPSPSMGVGDVPSGSISGGSTAAIAQQVLRQFPALSITSTFRGGNPASKHAIPGNPAVDIGGPVPVLRQAKAWLESQGFVIPTLFHGSGPHVHLHSSNRRGHPNFTGKLHSGGIVKRSMGEPQPGLKYDEVPAILQAGEQVIPKSQVGRSPNVTIDNSFNLSGLRDVIRSLRSAIARLGSIVDRVLNFNIVSSFNLEGIIGQISEAIKSIIPEIPSVSLYLPKKNDVANNPLTNNSQAQTTAITNNILSTTGLANRATQNQSTFAPTTIMNSTESLSKASIQERERIMPVQNTGGGDTIIQSLTVHNNLEAGIREDADQILQRMSAEGAERIRTEIERIQEREGTLRYDGGF